MQRGNKKKLATAVAAALLGAGLILAPIGAEAHHLADAGVAMTGLKLVDGGGNHTCGLTEDGGVWCWGNNATGQLGDALVGTVRAFPRRVSNMNAVKAVSLSLGTSHSCALTDTGDIWCWGLNLGGQVGRANLSLVQSVPVQLDIRQNGTAVKFSSVSAGNSHTCAVSTAGAAWCWGADDMGQLGRNNFSAGNSDPAPVWPYNMGTVRSITTGSTHTCAVNTAGQAWCWGDNADGQLGVGNVPQQRKPALVAETAGFPGGGITQLEASDFHTCAATNSGSMFCWGSNSFGRIGNPAGSSSRTPIKVQAHAAIAENAVDFKADRISLGIEHTCAWRERDGVAWCWGRGLFGQLGDGTPSSSVTLPRTRVKGETILLEPTGAITQLSSGSNHVCTVNEGGMAFCWGMNLLGQLGETTFVNHPQPAMVLQPL